MYIVLELMAFGVENGINLGKAKESYTRCKQKYPDGNNSSKWIHFC